MGGDNVTVQNLTVHSVDVDNGLLLIKGAIPGSNGTLVFVKSAAKGVLQPMSTVDIVILSRKEVRHGRPPRRDLRRAGQHPTDPPSGGGPVGCCSSGQRLDQASRRGSRWWTQAVPPEGHRSRPPGFDPLAAVRRWWCGARSNASGLRPAHPQEDEAGRSSRQRCPTGLARVASTSSARSSTVTRLRPRPRLRSSMACPSASTCCSSSSARTTSPGRACATSSVSTCVAPDQLNTYDVLISDDIVFTEASLADFLEGPVTGKSSKAVATESEARRAVQGCRRE